MNRLWRRWERFWFETPHVPQLKLFRFSFAMLLFVFHSIRTWDLELFYTESGVLPVQIAQTIMDGKHRFSLLYLFPSTGAAWAFHWIALTSLFCLAIGIFPRVSALISFVLHISFMNRSLPLAYGMDMISSFFLLYLCLGRYRAEGSALSSMAYRLCQIQLCVIYAYSGLEKLKGTHWWRGEAIWDVLANAQLARWDFSWASSFPVALVVANYLTLAWEIYFPVLVWNRRLRYPMLVFGVLLHAGIGLAVNIPFFSALMCIAYLLFLRREHAEAIAQRLGQLVGRGKPQPCPLPAPAAQIAS